jgi:Uncharacterized conserved protein
MKSIVLCADGTWNTPHADLPSNPDTNVRKSYCALVNGPRQLKYYDSAVGTDGTPPDHPSGGAMGEGLTLWTLPHGSFRPNDTRVEQVWFPGVHSDVGGGYQECELFNITPSWMMRKANENGLLLSPAAEDEYLSPKPEYAWSLAHDEWKIIPWGIPEHRQVPTAAVMSNTVQMRLDNHKDYRPENVLLNGDQLSGYPQASPTRRSLSRTKSLC